MDYKKYYRSRFIRHWISVPFIWMLIVPGLFFDVCLEIYHRLCFPLYGLKTVDRSEYIHMDRHKLKYLRLGDKINCLYCGYMNGLLHYACEIAARTEKYWCGIKHMNTSHAIVPTHHTSFIEYGNEDEFKEKCKLEK